MTAEELLKAGHLSAAVEKLNQEVRARPTDIQRRTLKIAERIERTMNQQHAASAHALCQKFRA